jgi:hypothetical protein
MRSPPWFDTAHRPWPGPTAVPHSASRLAIPPAAPPCPQAGHE